MTAFKPGDLAWLVGKTYHDLHPHALILVTGTDNTNIPVMGRQLLVGGHYNDMGYWFKDTDLQKIELPE